MPDPEKYPLFRLFMPTDGKILYFAKKLLTEYLYTDDRWRNLTTILKTINSHLARPNENVFYEIGQFDGILGFTDIIAGWQAHLTVKLWNPEIWGPDLVRQGKNFIQEVMDELYLFRLESATADPRIVRMAKMVGFKVEGVRQYGFSWGGKYYPEFLLSIIRQPEEINERTLSGKSDRNEKPAKPRPTKASTGSHYKASGNDG